MKSSDLIGCEQEELDQQHLAFEGYIGFIVGIFIGLRREPRHVL